MPLLFTRSPSPQLLLIPPFAESAKDGAPDPSFQSKMTILCDRVLTQALKANGIFDDSTARLKVVP